MFEFFTSQFGFSLLLVAGLFGLILGCVAYCILLERKVCAWIQDRRGPNRAGPAGLLQPVADGLKFFLKEDIISFNVDRPIFILAPAMAFMVAMIGFAVIPWGGEVDLGGESGPVKMQVASVDIGLLYILAVGSLSVYGIVLGGWASNNKFSFYGGMRAAAQMLSYEIPMGLAILVVVLTSGELRLERIVAIGGDDPVMRTWNILLHPLAFVVLLITVFAETNRTPFDLAEAEQELIGGYQTEYSSMKLALFYLGEYAHMITASAFISVLFLGGWELFPFSDGIAVFHWLNHDPSISAALLRFGVLFAKVAGFIFFFMWIRWTIPRFRFDQLMRLAWRGLVPIGIALVTLTAILVYCKKHDSVWATVGNLVILGCVLTWVVLSKSPITGRQAHLPSVTGTVETKR